MSIASYISDDIKQRIRTGATLPSNLTLVDLARHYDVSITPVRRAIQSLVDEGYLRKLSTRRIEVNPKKIGIGGSEEVATRPRRPSDWDEILLDDVIHVSLSLASVYLREGVLAEKYRVGRSIIRSTLSRFAGAGLLEHVPRRGWRVHPIRIEDVDAFLAVREAMELLALDAARPRVVRSDVMALLDGEQHHALDNATHRYFIEKSRNRYITAFFSQFVSRFYTKLLHFAAPEAEVVAEMTSEHVAFLHAILDTDWPQARDVLSRHIRGQKAVLERLLVGGSSPTGA
ncbi:MAG: GntR family transcriptional regulator [Spirochaetales bacterium]|nr:MAG: GntR family transcriptional regulator [Spirochaetales bacterium]